jgi:hypothetical protein
MRQLVLRSLPGLLSRSNALISFSFGDDMDAHSKVLSDHDPARLHHEFSVLSLADLLSARDKNHVDLMQRKNVVGTAVGLYLIRDTDPWPPKRTPHHSTVRTLANSGVRPYSWPCILVFVRKWLEPGDLRKDEQVPGSLYLDDNRKVPVCVVEAPPVLDVPQTPRRALFPLQRLGGGFPVVARVQGREHVASVGCLLTDGHTTYALTSRHVTGEPGEVVYAENSGELDPIGVSSHKSLTRKPFSEVYPKWPSRNAELHMDVGLIRVDDVNRWSAQVYGIGTIGDPVALGNDSLSLRLIDEPVRAYGCVSGVLKGAIKALFYRYAISSDSDIISDFLIGARDKKTPFATHPGDSGTVWFLDGDKSVGPQPIAVQWGGELFSDGSGPQQSVALATCLSTVCNLLDVDVIRDWNIGGFDYWGETGHYTIGALACTANYKGLPKLGKLLSNNLDRIGFEPADLKVNDKVLKNKAHYSFVPLADVADDVWRMSRPSDASNHFADMDEKATTGPYKGKTLLDLTLNDPANIDPTVWSNFYAGTPGTNPGALPFRVWQIYDEMVNYAKAGDIARFLCAAGCVAHYVGDACQPLHVSRLHHGIPPVKKGSVAYHVHDTYETAMINQNAAALVDGVVKLVTGTSVAPSFAGGHGAAARVIDLMRATFKTLPPADIVKTYNDAATPADRVADLWTAYGTATIGLMADGCLCLADIWASAWREAGAEQSAPQSALGAVDEKLLATFYKDPSFLPSVGLKQLAQILGSAPGANGVAPKKAAKTKTRVKHKSSKAIGKKPKKKVAKKK